MSAKVFVDTNVLVYARDKTSPSKQKAAESWLLQLARRSAIVVSRQSLREYYNVATGTKIRVPRPEIRREIVAMAAWLPADGGYEKMEEAWAIEDRYKFAFYDCLLLASGVAAGCTHFLSEDLHAGANVDGMRITDFTAVAPEQVLKD